MDGWTGLPPRDRRVLEWLLGGEVITAELATLLAYGGLRIAQRRLKKLVGYGLVRGFWAANSQRSRGRYAYALTRPTRLAIEALMWGGRQPRTADLEAPSPVIHQLATHDLLAAFLRASPLSGAIGLGGWAPERPTALAFHGHLRPDALAVIGVNREAVALFIERDLGSERIGVLLSKADAYSAYYQRDRLINVGFVVDSPRRAASVRNGLGERHDSHQRRGYESAPCWVAVASELIKDPFGHVWRSPDGPEVAAFEMPIFDPNDDLQLLRPGCLADEGDAMEAFDDRLLDYVGSLGRKPWS